MTCRKEGLGFLKVYLKPVKKPVDRDSNRGYYIPIAVKDC